MIHTAECILFFHLRTPRQSGDPFCLRFTDEGTKVPGHGDLSKFSQLGSEKLGHPRPLPSQQLSLAWLEPGPSPSIPSGPGGVRVENAKLLTRVWTNGHYEQSPSAKQRALRAARAKRAPSWSSHGPLPPPDPQLRASLGKTGLPRAQATHPGEG